METIKQMLVLLEEKKELFLQYEKETQKMNVRSPEDVEEVLKALETRDMLIEKIDEIDREIREICAGDPDGSMLMHASKNKCGLGELPEAYKVIFTAGQQIFQVITRIQELEGIIRMNLKDMQAEAQQKIRQNRQEKRFAGYLGHMTYDNSIKSGFLYDKKR